MNETLFIAVIVSVVSPSMLVVLNNWSARSARNEEEERQVRNEERAVKSVAAAVEVAEKAKVAAELLEAAQRETIRRTDEVAEAAKARDSDISHKLDVIHDFVNSDMTSALEALLISLRTQLVLTKRNLAADPTEDELAVVTALEIQIADLEVKIGERHRQQAIVDAALAKENGGDH